MRALLDRFRGGARPSRSAVAEPAPADEPGPAPASSGAERGGVELTLEQVLQVLREHRKDPFEVQFLAREVRKLEQADADATELRGRLEQLVERRLRRVGALPEGSPLSLRL